MACLVGWVTSKQYKTKMWKVRNMGFYATACVAFEIKQRRFWGFVKISSGSKAQLFFWLQPRYVVFGKCARKPTKISKCIIPILTTPNGKL